MPNPQNIIVGAAQVLINSVDVGYTKGGTTVRYEPEFLDVIADQESGVVRKNRTLERMYVTTTLLEVTLNQIRQAFMLPVANLTGGTSLVLGYNAACWVDEVTLTLIAVSDGNCGTRTFNFTKAVSIGNKEYMMSREEEVAFEVEFECLKNTSGQFGSVIDT
jgi:hypothetical protein